MPSPKPKPTPKSLPSHDGITTERTDSRNCPSQIPYFRLTLYYPYGKQRHGGFFKEQDADVIIGGPPCQGFSMAGARIRGGFMGDPRNCLFKHYFNVVKTVKPKVFVMENVKGITTMEKGKIFAEILSIFSDPSLLDGSCYKLFPRLVKAVDFGIPQKRERMIIIGVRDKGPDLEKLWDITKDQIKEQYPDYFDKTTLRDANTELSGRFHI